LSGFTFANLFTQPPKNWIIEFSDTPKYDIAGVSLFSKKHRRSPSHFNLKYGRENSPPESPVKEQRPPMPEPLDNKEGCEVSITMHKNIHECVVNVLTYSFNICCMTK
jgi:hypothetical protein